MREKVLLLSIKKSMSDWKFKRKVYPHFDKVLKNKKQVEILVEDPENVAKHCFFPFIERKQKNRKLKKNKNKIRPIKYASHIDSQLFSYYRDNFINKKYEEKLEQLSLKDNIIAYRKIPIEDQDKGKCNIHFAKEAFDTIVSIGNCVALTFDISGFFDSLSHDFLEAKLKDVLGINTLPKDYKSIFKALTSYSVVQYDDCYETLGFIKREGEKKRYLHCPRYVSKKKKILCSKEIYRKKIVSKGLVKKNDTLKKGIPQGASLSDVLANIYMLDFDKAMKELENETNGYYRRYSDDILWICLEKDVEKVKLQASELIKKLCGGTLEISQEKTTETKFLKSTSSMDYEGDKFEYLGFRFDGKTAFFRDGTISRYKRKTIYNIRKYVKICKARCMKSKNAKPLMDFVKREKIFQTVFYANKRWNQQRLYGNFMSYVERAKKIFNKDNKRQYSLSNKQLLGHKKWVHKKIDEEINKVADN